MFIGVNNLARKIKNCYVGVDGKARKIKAVYVGVDGKARLVWQQILDKVKSFSSVIKTNPYVVDSIGYSYKTFRGGINPYILIPSKNDNAVYLPTTTDDCHINNDYTSTKYCIRKIIFNGDNISSVKTITVGDYASGTNYSGEYYRTSITFNCLFEFGDYLFCAYSLWKNGESFPTAYMCLCDMDNEKILSSSVGVPEIKSGFTFNDTTAVVSYGAAGVLGLIKRNGTGFSVTTYKLINPETGYSFSGTEHFKVAKISNNIGVVIGYYGYLYACAFRLNSDNTLTLGTLVKHNSNTICNDSDTSSFISIDHNTAIFSCTYSSSGEYYSLYHIPVIVDDNLNVTFGTHLYDGYDDWRGSMNFSMFKIANKSFGGLNFSKFELLVYEYNTNTKSITKNTLALKNASGDTSILHNLIAPLGSNSNKLVGFNYTVDSYINNTYTSNLMLVPYILEIE